MLGKRWQTFCSIDIPTDSKQKTDSRQQKQTANRKQIADDKNRKLTHKKKQITNRKQTTNRQKTENDEKHFALRIFQQTQAFHNESFAFQMFNYSYWTSVFISKRKFMQNYEILVFRNIVNG